jgi:hypothetical protein
MPTRKNKPDDPPKKTGGEKKGKARKPSFAIGGALPVEPRTGWVYRTEQAQAKPPAAPAAALRAEPAPAAPRARKTPPAAAGVARNAWPQWLAAGAEAAVLPFQVALVLALAPVQWLTCRGVKERK